MKVNEAILRYKPNFLKWLNELLQKDLESDEKEVIVKLIDFYDKDITPLHGTNISINEAGEVVYLRPISNKPAAEWKEQTSSMQRFFTRLFNDLGIEMKPARLDNFCRKLKAYAIKPKLRVKLVVGEAIRWSYLVDNCIKTGSVSTSCMNKLHTQDYLDLYVKNQEKVALLIVINEKNLICARRLVWNTDQSEILTDVIYSAATEYTDIIINWTKNLDLRNSDLIIPDRLLSSIMTDLDKEFLKTWEDKLKLQWLGPNDIFGKTIELNVDGIDAMPYIDTFSSFNRLNNYKIELVPHSTGEFKCKRQDGKFSCSCWNCEGKGSKPCDECMGKGKIYCDACGGDGEFECDCDNGKSSYECDTCNGDGFIGDSQNDCKDCEGTGLADCKVCDGTGKFSCTCNEGYVECTAEDPETGVECSNGDWYCVYCEEGIIIEDNLQDIF